MTSRTRQVLLAAIGLCLIALVAFFFMRPGDPSAGWSHYAPAPGQSEGAAPATRALVASDRPIQALQRVTVQGTVTDRDGVAIPGASASLRRRDPGASQGASLDARTDRSGAFVIEGAASPADLRLLIEAEGFRPVTVDALGEPQAGLIDVGVVKLVRISGIAGRVIDTQSVPVPGANVELLRSIDWEAREPAGFEESLLERARARTRTDALGRFEFSDLAPRSYNLVAEADGMSWEALWFVGVVRDRVTSVEIVLGTARGLVGEVVNADAVPVPDATVLVDMDGLHAVRRITDASGRFSVPVPDRTRFGFVQVNAFKPGVGIGYDVFRGERLKGVLRVQLLRTRMLSVQLTPDDGAPPPANVRLGVSVLSIRPHFASWWSLKTDASGSASVADFPELPALRVKVDDPLWCLLGQSPIGNSVKVTPTGDVTIDVPITRTGSLAGTVVDRYTGNPVPGLAIEAVPRMNLPRASGKHYRLKGVTDAKGAFVFQGLQRTDIGIITRSTQWLIWPDGWNGGPVGGKDGFERNDFFGRYPLEKTREVSGVVVGVVESGTVSGIVVDAAGNPIEGAEVGPRIEDLSDPRRMAPIDGRTFAEDFETRTDRAGRFELRGVYPGFAVQVGARRPEASWTWSEAFKLMPGTTMSDLKLTLPTGKRVVAEVVSPDGKPVGEVAVSVSEGDRFPPTQALTRRTGADGCTTFESLTGDKISIGVDPGTLPEGLQVDESFERVVMMAAGDTTRITIPLRPELLLRGKVVLEGGTAFGGGGSILVRLVGATDSQPLWRPAVESGKVSDDGTFSMRVRSAGAYELREVVRSPASLRDTTFERFVPVRSQELRPGESVTLVVRPK